jgi:hypothetical protein
MSVNRNVVVAVVAIVALLASAGAALAAASAGQDVRVGRCDAWLAKAAERRGISAEQLEARIEARRLARVDAALRAGRISPERAAALRARISARRLCPRPPLVRIALAHRPLLRATAGYLDLRPGELRVQLSGTSLAALAQARGKSVEDLEAAMRAPAQARLARAVAAGRIAQPRADRVLTRLERRIDRLVQRIFPAR